MAKDNVFYRQCELSQGTGRDIAYIEERGAVEGRTVELGGAGSGNYWTVTSVSDKRVPAKVVKDLQAKHHAGWGSLIDI